jgi:cell division protein FtsW (lipid II flippase)
MRKSFFFNSWLLVFIIPFPCLVLGSLLMYGHGLSIMVWGQNPACGLVLILMCIALSALPPVGSTRLKAWLTIALSAALLSATFTNIGMQGVHRWVRVGLLLVHAGAICLPALVVALGTLTRTAHKPGTAVILLGTVIMALLAFQPDAAQATAFAGALFILWFPSYRHNLRLVYGLAGIAALAALAWTRPDPLPSVAHVEGILQLAAQKGVFWLASSIVALMLLPLPFLLARSCPYLQITRALGSYFCFCLASPLWGAFPVPLLGYGSSSVIGYFVALGWLVSCQRIVSLMPYEGMKAGQHHA